MSGKNKVWSNLKTVKRFDRGSNADTFFQISELSSKYGVLPRSCSSSMAIICLVEKLYALIERDPIKSHKLTEALLKQLRSMGLIDEKCDSPDFEEMRNDFRTALCTMVKMNDILVNGDTITSLQPVKSFLDEVDNPCSRRSRYSTEFEMLGYISRGGFGKVFRVRNRLDGCKYAIKKISVRSQNDFYRSVLKEVTLLAKLQHPNIVKYYTAWLEPASPSDSVRTIRIVEEKDETSEFVLQTEEIAGQDLHHWTYLETKQHNQKFSSLKRKLATTSEESSDASYVEFRSESQGSGIHVDCTTSQKIDQSGTSCLENSSFSEAISSSFSLEEQRGAIVPRNSSDVVADRAVLYIQMELCGQSLRKWLDFRPIDAEPSSMLGFLQLHTRLSCFWQLTAALEYLHSQNIVHHDIKPSNIFVFGNNRLKLGDFGLACSYENSKAMVHHAWGTCTYAAPEQLKGGLCNFKSDVYSTGLVLLELLMPPFHTNAERIHVLSQLREQGFIPDIIAKQLPLWSDLAQRLTNAEPYKRPSSRELKCQVEVLMCQEPNVSKTQIEASNILEAQKENKNKSSIHLPYQSSTSALSFEKHVDANFQMLDGLSLEGTQTYLTSSLNYSSALKDQKRYGVTLNDTQVLFNNDKKKLHSLELENQKLRVQILKLEHQIILLEQQVRLLNLQM